MYGECIRVKLQKFAWTVGRREGSEAEAGGDEGVRQIEINENETILNTPSIGRNRLSSNGHKGVSPLSQKFHPSSRYEFEREEHDPRENQAEIQRMMPRPWVS